MKTTSPIPFKLHQLFALAVALCAWLLTPAAWGAAKYYSTTAGALNWANTGGSSLWGTATGGPYNAAWASGDSAVFEGTGGAVTVSGAVTTALGTSSAGGIGFTVDGYNLSAELDRISASSRARFARWRVDG